MADVPDLTTLTAHTTARAADVMADLTALLAVMDPNAGPDTGIDGRNMQHGTAGQLWVADSSGIYQKRSLSGDATLGGTGALAIADGAVTSRKFAPVSGVKTQTTGLAGADLSTTTWADIAGTTLNITPTVPSVLWVAATSRCTLNDTSHSISQGLEVALNVDGTREPLTMEMYVNSGETGSDNLFVQTIARSWLIDLTAAAHVLKLQARREDVLGTVTIAIVKSTLQYLLAHN